MIARRTSLASLAVSFVVIFLLGACGSETSGSDDTSATEAGGGGGGSSITIESPEDGAEIPASFTVELSTDEELSMSDSEALHVHLVYDGNEQESDMIDSESFDVTGLESGEHTITASLRDSAHAPTGPEDAITVMVEGAGGEKDDEKDGGSDKY